MIEMCEEMKKLRSLLDVKGVEWTDESSICSEQMINECLKFYDDKISRRMLDTTIYRTHFIVNNHRCSAIYGYGTYGGYDPIFNQDSGLLELMPDLDNMGDPIGFLTAEEVIQKCFGD